MKKFPLPGWLGLFILVLAEVSLLMGSEIVATWFTPIMWTGYILLVDTVVRQIRGTSRLSSNPREIPFLLLISIGVWLLFEMYNLHLHNWEYVGTPADPTLRNLGYAWSFATIMPGVFVTIDLVQAIFSGANSVAHWELAPQANKRSSSLPILLGLVMLLIPLALPEKFAAYLFGSVWLGFIFILEPVNRRIKAISLFPTKGSGNYRSVLAVLFAGLLCGFIWETWNYQSFGSGGAYWIYTIPEPLGTFGGKFGMMPLLGLIGFPPFAWELILLYECIRDLFGGDRRFGSRSATNRGRVENPGTLQR